MKNKAIFFDRDGVLNKLIFNPKTGEYESPHTPQDFIFNSNAVAPLQHASKVGYSLFLISNQPSFTKGKTSLENINSIHQLLLYKLDEIHVQFTEYYYCYHHPTGDVPNYSKICECRKPGNFFLKKAKQEFNLDLTKSWFVGDQDSDIFCGQSMNCHTIQIETPESASKRGKAKPDFKVSSISDILKII